MLGKLVANDTLEGLKELFAGTRTLIVSVKGDVQAVREACESMEGTKKVEVQTESQTGLVTVQITLSKDADIREALSLKLAELKMPVMSMVLDEKQLEDIFIELTGADAELAADMAKVTKEEK